MALKTSCPPFHLNVLLLRTDIIWWVHVIVKAVIVASLHEEPIFVVLSVTCVVASEAVRGMSIPCEEDTYC